MDLCHTVLRTAAPCPRAAKPTPTYLDHSLCGRVFAAGIIYLEIRTQKVHSLGCIVSWHQVAPRDGLCSGNSCVRVSPSALVAVLSFPEPLVSGMFFQILDRVADGMAFGALLPCKECSGQLVFKSDAYYCTGDVTAWTKCMVKTQNPSRKEWVTPKVRWGAPGI